jgi:hypothetical protein
MQGTTESLRKVWERGWSQEDQDQERDSGDLAQAQVEHITMLMPVGLDRQSKAWPDWGRWGIKWGIDQGRRSSPPATVAQPSVISVCARKRTNLHSFRNQNLKPTGR